MNDAFKKSSKIYTKRSMTKHSEDESVDISDESERIRQAQEEEEKAHNKNMISAVAKKRNSAIPKVKISKKNSADVSEKSTENSHEKQRHSLLHSIESKQPSSKFDFSSL